MIVTVMIPEEGKATDNIKSEFEAMGYGMDTHLMRNREEWRQIVRSAKTHQGL